MLNLDKKKKKNEKIIFFSIKKILELHVIDFKRLNSPLPDEFVVLTVVCLREVGCTDEVNCSLASLAKPASLSLLESLPAPVTCLSSLRLRCSSAAACCLRAAPFFRFTYHRAQIIK